MDTMGGEGEPLNDIGVHDRPVKMAGDCNTCSVNGQLHYKMSTWNDSSEVCARDYGKRRFFRDGKNCSMQGLIHGLRYEMSQLGAYVCIMEFDLEERYYRYLNSYKGGHEAKVMERIRILVLIPF